jgi:hypothetical protein
MGKMTIEELKVAQADLKRQRIFDLTLGKQVAELDNLTLKKATHLPFYTGLTISRRLSSRTINCVGKIEPFYKTFNNKIVRGYRIHSEQQEEVLVNGKMTICKKHIVQETFRPIIFAMSHIGKFDIEIVEESLPHSFLLSGDFENLHGTPSGSLLEKHGIVYLDMFDKEDKKNVKKVLIQVLSNGNNVLWCIEGTWNFSPNELIQGCPFGFAEVAEKSGAVVLPIGVQQFNDTDFCVRIGELIDPIEIRSNYYLNTDAVKKHTTEQVRDAMATQVYYIIDDQGVFPRNLIPEKNHEEYIEKRLAEWNFTLEEVESKKFIPPYIIPDKETHIVARREFHPPYFKPFLTFNEETFDHMLKFKTLPSLQNRSFTTFKEDAFNNMQKYKALKALSSQSNK